MYCRRKKKRRRKKIKERRGRQITKKFGGEKRNLKVQ